MPGPDDRLKGALERLAAPADPSGAYERIVEKKFRRRFMRRAQIAGLVMVVLAGTIGGTFALAHVFGSGPASPRPVAPSARKGKIAFVTDRDGNNEIYVMDADGTNSQNLTRSIRDDQVPAWSPDGKRIAFVSNREERTDIYVMNSDGSDATRLTRGPPIEGSPAWSRDGKWIAFTRSDLSSDLQVNVELWVMRADGRDQRRITPSGESVDPDSHPSWSPDGREIVFAALVSSPVSGCPTNAPCPATAIVGLQVINPDGSGRKVIANPPFGARRPDWSPDGRSILFEGDGTLYLVRSGGSHMRPLSEVGSALTPSHPSYRDYSPAWSPDGRRIAFVTDRDGNQEVYVMNADGSRLSNLTRNASGDFAPSWQPLPAGVPSSPSGSPSPSPEPTPSPSPAWPLPRCATSWVNGDFDGDGLLDTAAVCRLKGGTFSLNVQWASGAAGAVSLPDCQSVCEARGAGDLNGDGKDEFFLVFSAGASTEFVEVYELPTSEIFGQHPAKIAPPGSPPGFPPGASAQFDLGGSVTHQGYLTCTIPKGGLREVVSTRTVLSSDQTTWKVHETRFSFSPGKAGLGQFAVVSVRDYTAPVDPDRPFVPPGDPCLDV
ncbi:MAG TPA: hypothetical protein VF986_08395 [Actinomycetota bacterium]